VNKSSAFRQENVKSSFVAHDDIFVDVTIAKESNGKREEISIDDIFSQLAVHFMTLYSYCLVVVLINIKMIST